LFSHPDIQVRRESESFELFNSAGAPVCGISVVGGEASLIPSRYCPEFGVQKAGQTIRLSLDVELPAEFGFTIERT
jgi:hypothetical protein